MYDLISCQSKQGPLGRVMGCPAEQPLFKFVPRLLMRRAAALPLSLGCPLVTISTPSSVTAPVKGSKSRSVPYTSCPCISSIRQVVLLLEASTVGLALLHISGWLHSLLHLLFLRQGLLVNSELVSCDSLSGHPPSGIIVSPLY